LSAAKALTPSQPRAAADDGEEGGQQDVGHGEGAAAFDPVVGELLELGAELFEHGGPPGV
jgi:hypothetical protein